MADTKDSQEITPAAPHPGRRGGRRLKESSYNTGATPSKGESSLLALPLHPLIDFVARINLSVHAKLLSGFLTGAVLLLGMGIISLLVIERMSDRVEDLTLRQEVVDHARQIGHLVTAQSHFRAMALLTNDDTNNVKIANAKTAFLQHLDVVEKNIEAEQGEFFRGVRESNDRFAASSDRVLQFYLAGELEAALKLHLDEEHVVSHELEDAMRELVASSNMEMNEAVAAFYSDRGLLRIIVAVFSGISLLLALLLGIVLSGSFVRPVRKIDRAVAAIAGGDFSQRVEVPNRDELGTLSKNVNGMSEQLAGLYEKLREELAERERVEEAERLRTLELEALVHIAGILVQPNSFEEKCKHVLDEVAQLVEADWVTLRVPEEEGLRLVTVAGPATLESPPMIVLSDSETLALDAFQNGQPVLVNDYFAYPQASAAYLALGVQSLVLMPIKASGPTVGLVNVLSREPNHFTPDRVRVLTAVADGLGVLLENAQAHAAALQASATKSDFLASMSHEIRTPMNSIIGMAELLSNTPLNSEQQQYVQLLTKAGDTLLTLIDDVLDLSKVEAGRLVLETVDFDLTELVEDTAEYLAIRAHAKGLELNCSISHDVPTTLVGDPGRLRQVVTNLVGNAIKFTEEGEVTLRIETYPGASNNSFVLFRVSDTGIGIHPEQLDKIFDDFTQADSSMTRKFGGTGLGLAIVRRLVEMMEGRIWVESEIGHGSTFYFTVQLQVGAEPASPVEPTWENIKGLKTLVVDDNANNRLILQEMLAARGITAKAVEDGYRALVELDEAKKGDDSYQLVLLDRRMPGMDGFQVVERIKDQLGIVDITILLLTSENRSEDIARCRELGVSRYLVKPVKQSELIQAILAARGFESAVAEAQPPKATTDTVHEPRVLRILLVEDSEDNRLLVQAHLNNAGHKIDLAENGEVAVEKFVSGQYDLVLMDMQMPVMDGYDATRAIRKWESDQAVEATPIIALTAHALKEDTQKSLDAGCTDHLTKPLKKKRLMEVIYEHARTATV